MSSESKLSKIVQSLSRGRKKVVEVERRSILSKTPKGKTLSVIPAEDGTLVANLKKVQLKKSKKKTKTGKGIKAKQKRRSKPSFLNSTGSKSPITRYIKSISASPNRPTNTVARGGFGIPSAGMPGNEEVDPPRRRSASTPSTRYLDLIQRR